MKSHKVEKRNFKKIDKLIRNTPKTKPYVDEHLGVLWGTNKDDPDTLKVAKQSNRTNRTKRNKTPVRKEVYSRIPVYKLIDND